MEVVSEVDAKTKTPPSREQEPFTRLHRQPPPWLDDSNIKNIANDKELGLNSKQLVAVVSNSGAEALQMKQGVMTSLANLKEVLIVSFEGYWLEKSLLIVSFEGYSAPELDTTATLL